MGKHKEWRRIAKKCRRKRLRQELAKTKHAAEEQERKRHEKSPSYLVQIKKQEEDEKFAAEEEARLKFEAEQRWLEAEEEAQKQWRKLQERLEEAREERTRQNLLIKLEWEKEQQRLKALKEAKEREKQDMERREQILKKEIEDFVANGGDTPPHLKVNVEMNPNKPICPFFQKTSACRFRDSCSRNHIKPGVSRILLIPNFYSHYSLEQGENEHGDSCLEFESDETYSHFKDFFFDVLPEMEQCGKIRQFKVCCNREGHLRGNVYVEYSSTREAVKSFQTFNGRWYGGKQLSVEFCNIESWKSAICGLFARRRCPKGSSCNFLHVFQNPNNMFHLADRDEHRTPPKTKRRRQQSEERNWRWSESPERFILDEFKKRRRERKRSHSKKRKRARSRGKRRKE